MALLAEKELLSQIKKSEFCGVYVFVGEEQGKKDFFIDALTEAALGGVRNSFNYELRYADEISVEELGDMVRNGSLWQGRKIVNLKRIEKWSAKEQEKLLPLLDEDLGEAVLVMSADKLDGRSKFMQKFGSSKAVLIRCEALKDIEVSFWLKTMATKHHLKLVPETAEYLERAGIVSVLDMDQLMKKLVLFSSDVVTPEHLREVQFWSKPESVFAYTDAILSRQGKLALELLLQLEQQGEEPLQLLGLVSKQFRNLYQIYGLRQSGKGEQAIVSELRLFPRQAKGLFAALSRRRPEHLSRAILAVARADLAIKSTREPAFGVLQRLSIELT